MFGDTIDETRYAAGGLEDGLDGIGEEEFGGATGGFEPVENVLIDLIPIPAFESETDGDSLCEGIVDGEAQSGFDLLMTSEEEREIVPAHRHRNWS